YVRRFRGGVRHQPGHHDHAADAVPGGVLMRSQRRAVTLLECLVTLIASTVILGGLFGLFTVADQAARGNVSDVFTSAMDYNLDRVLSEIATSTSAGGAPTRQAIAKTGTYGDTAPSHNMILVYERTRDIRSTAYWNAAQGGPNGTNPQ